MPVVTSPGSKGRGSVPDGKRRRHGDPLINGPIFYIGERLVNDKRLYLVRLAINRRSYQGLGVGPPHAIRPGIVKMENAREVVHHGRVIRRSGISICGAQKPTTPAHLIVHLQLKLGVEVQEEKYCRPNQVRVSYGVVVLTILLLHPLFFMAFYLSRAVDEMADFDRLGWV
ncbi:hypothetical protein J6590_034656 [Homalodisca vitripennis]|nr:hypothetical protein J6590_034656 [Homalodisca vitripennis]